jgi:hypothetical protein
VVLESSQKAVRAAGDEQWVLGGGVEMTPTPEACQAVVDRLLEAQTQHQEAGGRDNIFGMAMLTIVNLSKQVHGADACFVRETAEMRLNAHQSKAAH